MEFLFNKDKYLEFYPTKNMSKLDKSHAIARFAIYYGILIYIFDLDSKWLSISAMLLILSLYLTSVDTFVSTDKCTKPTSNNPFMNFIFGDEIDKSKACELTEDVRNEQIKLFRNESLLDKTDLYGKNSSDRNFYTMPSTTALNDQEGFARFMYGDFNHCKADGKNCLKHRDNKYHRGRLSKINNKD
jgi:hypothetical protein